jgi:organic radical activating enzyme
MKKKLADMQWDIGYDNKIARTGSNVDRTKELLDSTGCGFCLAKFTQVTMHLGTGMTHACHHPVPHKIPIEEIEKNPAALFNTEHLKQARREMKSGERPPECDYCWRIEDNKSPSDRFYKSLEPWALERHDEIQAADPNQDFFPSYLEVDFSNVCNFKCVYCGPEYSSKWVEELKQNGPVKLLENTDHVVWAQGWQKDLDSLSYRNNEFNPYIDAFWKWWPEAYKHLHVYRITGGEPLLSKETYRSMDWFIENPNPNLEFSINTNLGVPDKLWDKFIERVEILSTGNYIKKLTIFTSVDAWGERAEYLRPGLNFEKFKQRYEQIMAMGNVRITTMVTFNILSISSIQKLFEWQLELRKKYNPNSVVAGLWEKDTGFNFAYPEESYTDRDKRTKNHPSINGIDLPYLRSPAFLDAQWASKDLIQQFLLPSINYMADHTTSTKTWKMHHAFEEFELEKFKRVCLNIAYNSKSDVPGNKDFILNRARFYDFVNDLDRRYGTDFLEVYPEYKEFYEICKAMKKKVVNKDV